MAVEEAYMLPRNDAESKRLDTQHDYMRALAHGHLVHPSVDKSQLNRVADVGTGTGIWLRETAQEIAKLDSSDGNTKFVGFDISSEQFQQENCPGIEFVLHDATQPFPDQYQETFDLVHVRLLSYAARAKDLRRIVENIVDLLRPGAFLHWEEVDAIDCWAEPDTPRARTSVLNVVKERVARGLTPAIATPLVKTIQSLTLPLRDGTFSPLTWTEDVMRIMQLETISTEDHEAPLVKAMTREQVISGAIMLNEAGIQRRLASASDPSKSVDEVERLHSEVAEMKELVEAIKQGKDPASSEWNYEMTRILARKIVVASKHDQWFKARR